MHIVSRLVRFPQTGESTICKVGIPLHKEDIENAIDIIKNFRKI